MQDTSHLPLDNLNGSVWLRGVGVALVAMFFLVMLLVGGQILPQWDPYIESVMELPGDPTHGASLFALNCAACHGEEADGRVGPSLKGLRSRRSDRFVIEQVTSGNTPPMPQFQPDPKEMADLLSYLKTL